MSSFKGFYYKGRKSVPHRRIKDTILILCEGKETEPNYFKSFKKDLDKFGIKIDIEIEGIGYNTDLLVKKAIKLKQKREDIIEVWCVFDRDNFKEKHFKDAFVLARENKIEIAYSIECFEIWFLLHFDYIKSAISRKDYNKKLSKLLHKKYKKNAKDMYNLLKNKQEIAIKNAKKLENNYSNMMKIYDRNPSTTVYKLVERLNEYKK